ncbi:non-processive endocellulase [Paenibacillus cellulosilyticus]|uniref:Endoglucanase n=1 Tax=Paenibacillus cellulosilyticus TaxID=375489 RepID=A0A2V2YN17_9BACL|nr:glycoside hydrolase family 9 protein [Paenibacillus cellulosilyticus]PWV95721.1 non-processive endocellulase [Paenibacillus cellulosilyticus]QKS47645.1 glycoside hydrolase family 9 protein [Paenibacillus cellulosilyticus]
MADVRREQWNEAAIRVNQIGFSTGFSKTFSSQVVSGSFEVVNIGTNETVLKGTTSTATADEAAGIKVSLGRLDGLDAPGKYRIRMKGLESPVFEIAQRPYQAIKLALLKNFYYQRCGMELEERYAGPWKHAACHLDHGTIHGDDPSIKRRTAGGWHDAGDYGKYMVAAAKAVADLMLAYEAYPTAFEESTDIPESGNGVPDILNEVRYELEWMLLLQREDGAVYHKLTTYEFPGLHVMPEDDLAPLVFSPASFSAAGTFAASMAMAARVFASFDETFASICREAAERAWGWMESTESFERVSFRNPRDVKTGEYGDQTVIDEHYWAAAELYRLTGDHNYLVKADRLAQSGDFPLCELGWADVGGYGTIALIGALRDAGEDSSVQLRERLTDQWLTRADELLELSLRNGFGVSLTLDQYKWGSSMIVMNHGMHLLIAAELTQDSDRNHQYLEAAAQQWHYLLGCNVLGICYVTGFGFASVMHPHHRPSIADGVPEPVPGIVAGGPNSGLNDTAAASLLVGCPPMACFIDHEDSYSTNENTIYWNSPAVYVAAALDSLNR